MKKLIKAADDIGGLYQENTDIGDVYYEGEDLGELYDDVRASRILSAEKDAGGGSGLDDALDNLSADFDYIIEGIDRVGRTGSENDAIALAMQFQEMANGMVNQVADATGGGPAPEGPEMPEEGMPE